MSNKASEKPENQSGKPDMEAAMEVTVDDSRQEMGAIMRDLAGADTSVKARIRRAARELKIPFGRARGLWYGESVVKAHELDNARLAQMRRRKKRLATLRAEVETLEKMEAEYARNRAEFLQAHPRLGRLVPAAAHEAAELMEALEAQASDQEGSVSED